MTFDAINIIFMLTSPNHLSLHFLVTRLTGFNCNSSLSSAFYFSWIDLNSASEMDMSFYCAMHYSAKRGLAITLCISNPWQYSSCLNMSCRSEMKLHPFNGLFSRTTWVSQHQKARTILDFNEARYDRVALASAGPYANHLHLTPDR